jgi:hypothetical protein
MLELAQDDSVIYIVQQYFIVLGFVRKPAIIDKDILQPRVGRPLLSGGLEIAQMESQNGRQRHDFLKCEGESKRQR